MKHYLIRIFLILLSTISVSAQGLYVGVEGKKMFERDNSFPYWEFGAFASYSQPLFQRLGFDVEAGLNTRYYPEGSVVWLASGPDTPTAGYKHKQHAVTFGGKIAADLTLKVAGPISLFGGFIGNCNFFQKDYIAGHAENFGLHRAGVQSRLGITGDISRIRIRAAWVYDLTKQDLLRQSGAAISVAYRL